MTAQTLSKLYHLLIQSRYFHVETESAALHEALGDYYEAAGDLIDQIIEVGYGETMSRLKRKIKIPELTEFTPEKCVFYYKEMNKSFEDMKAETENSGLKNLYDELIALTTKLLYLTTLKK